MISAVENRVRVAVDNLTMKTLLLNRATLTCEIADIIALFARLKVNCMGAPLEK